MKLALWRAVLDPVTSFRAVFIQQRSTTSLSYDTAWRQARMHRHPDDMPYRLHGHQPQPPTDTTDHQPVNPPSTDAT